MSKSNTKGSKRKPSKQPAKASTTLKRKPPGRKPGDKGRLEANKGAAERAASRALRAFNLRVQGWTIRRIAEELCCSISTVHEDIEAHRLALRAQTMDLAAQEREVALQQIDEAIAEVVPHIRGEVQIQSIEEGKNGPIVITVETYKARMAGVKAFCALQDRKAKLLGLDAPLKIDDGREPPKPPDETLRAAGEVLRKWGVPFAPRAIQGETVDG